jgi:hypothetical protein
MAAAVAPRKMPGAMGFGPFNPAEVKLKKAASEKVFPSSPAPAGVKALPKEAPAATGRPERPPPAVPKSKGGTLPLLRSGPK